MHGKRIVKKWEQPTLIAIIRTYSRDNILMTCMQGTIGPDSFWTGCVLSQNCEFACMIVPKN
jgi:hypothetical protein